jgi:hypothetical protein
MITLMHMLLVTSAILKRSFLACAQSEDYYCGTGLEQAMDECPLACPTGDDVECSSGLGSDYVCYYFTGCAEKIANGFVPAAPNADASVEETMTDAPVANVVETQSPTAKITPAPVDAVETSHPTPQPIEAETAPPTPQPIETKSPVSAPVAAPTSKPTNSPTLPPLTDAPVTPKPTNPLSTPSPTSTYIESLKTASWSELNGNADSTTSTSYGYIFTLRTTKESPVMQIVGFDFLTASTNNLNFELYSKAGTFAGYKGYYGRWVMIGRGTVKGETAATDIIPVFA